MAYSAEVVKRARARLAQAKEDRESENRQHLAEAYRRVPRIREIDMELRLTMAQAAQAAFLQGSCLSGHIALVNTNAVGQLLLGDARTGADLLQVTAVAGFQSHRGKAVGAVLHADAGDLGNIFHNLGHIDPP